MPKEKLDFIFTKLCGPKFRKTIDRTGHWDEHKNMKVEIRNRGKECENCIKEDGSLFCPALGILLSRNGKKIIYPL